MGPNKTKTTNTTFTNALFSNDVIFDVILNYLYVCNDLNYDRIWYTVKSIRYTIIILLFKQ